ncbi:MAG: hypothetical protein Q9207_001250 [Kuettlingeria erythrocarpa]
MAALLAGSTLLLLSLLQSTLLAAQPLEIRATVVDSASSLKDGYDYVVIGGGTSGLTVANRLTEDASGVPPPAEYSRNYQSVPQPGLNNKPQAVNSAAVVGGGTVINGMFFNRGSAGDYDNWAKLGNPGWGWKDLLPYFKKVGPKLRVLCFAFGTNVRTALNPGNALQSETFTPAPKTLSAQYPISDDLGPHGTDGPVQISFPQYQYPVLKYFYAAWNAIGVPSNPQPNDGRAVDALYGTLSLTAYNQSRCSASTAYYRPIAGKRRNLHLLTLHSVTKILIDEHKRATGVQVRFGIIGSRRCSHTDTGPYHEEVIVAAGALRSPQLLQVSGIGPRKLLKSLGIDVVQNLPGVGYNFQDQPAMFASVAYDYSKYPFPSPDWYFTNQSWVAQQLEIYYQSRTGPVTQAYLSGTTVAFLSLQRTTDQYQKIIRSAQNTDLQKALPAGADKTPLEGYRAQQSVILANYASVDIAVFEAAFLGGVTVPLVLTKPLSRGSILVNSSDALADPVFDYRTFQHPSDMQVFIEMFKKFRQFVAAEPWKAIGLEEASPGSGVQGDQAIEAAIRNITSSTWSHPVG